MMIGRQMRAMDATVSVDPGTAIVGGQPAGPGVSITGEQAPVGKKDWWPWVLGAAALAAIWWLVKDDVAKEGAGVPRPFVG